MLTNNLVQARFTGAINTSSFGINSFLQRSAISHRSRYNITPLGLATPHSPVNGDKSAWGSEDEINLGFAAIDENCVEMPAHAWRPCKR